MFDVFVSCLDPSERDVRRDELKLIPDGGCNTPESKVIWSRRISWEEQYQDSTTAQLPGLRYVHERCRHKAGYKYGREKRHMCHWRDINKPPTKKGLIAAGGI